MNRFLAILLASAALAVPLFAQQPPSAQAQPTPQQRVAMLKGWLQASQMQLRAYQWLETTVVAKGGEEKSRKQNQVYYDVNGQLQKVPTQSSGGEASGPRGPLRKRAAANAKEEMTEYMQQAVELVHAYIPPDPNRIQQSVNGGKFAINMVEPGRRVRLDFHDYLKAGDTLGIEIEVPTNRLLGMHVSSYLDSQKDAVNLDVAMGLLPDGTIYTQKSTLAATAKDITVTIENSGHRRTGG